MPPRARVATIIAAIWVVAFGQSIEFEVASVKPASDPPRSSEIRGGPGSSDPERITYANQPLRTLLANAYGVHVYQVKGPSWLDVNRYDIEAVIPSSSNKGQVQAMLRNLLSKRFNLVVHHETKLLPYSAITVAKGGAKLTPADPGVSPPTSGAGNIPGLTFDRSSGPQLAPGSRRAMIFSMGSTRNFRIVAATETLSEFADRLTAWDLLQGLVVDKTGLTGAYDFRLDFSADQSADDPTSPRADFPSLIVAVEEQLGLAITTSRNEQEIIVVDRADKVPTGN